MLERGRYRSASLAFGSVVHAGAAAHWNTANPQAAVAGEWGKLFGSGEISTKDVSLDLAQAMVQQYQVEAQPAGPFTAMADDWKLVTVETRLVVPIGAYRLSFQVDRYAHSQSRQQLVVIDTKTAARLDLRWERQWETSLQMKLYKLGMQRAYDIPNVDVVVEGVLKDVPSRLKYVLAPEWSQELLLEAERQFEYIAERDWQLIKAAMGQDGSVDMAKLEELAVTQTTVNYGDCYSYNVECPFRRLCVAEPDERVALLRGEYFEVESEY